MLLYAIHYCIDIKDNRDVLNLQQSISYLPLSSLLGEVFFLRIITFQKCAWKGSERYGAFRALNDAKNSSYCSPCYIVLAPVIPEYLHAWCYCFVWNIVILALLLSFFILHQSTNDISSSQRRSTCTANNKQWKYHVNFVPSLSPQELEKPFGFLMILFS